MANSNKKILVVEDDKFLLKVYATKFKKEGFNISLAEDGVEALEITKKEQPDLILLDLILPKMHGFEVLKKLKENPKTKNIPVFILSNLGQDTDVEKGKKLGAVDYLIKTDFSIQEVVDKINKTLK